MMYLVEPKIGIYAESTVRFMARSHYMTLTADPCESTMSYYISNLYHWVNPLLF